MNSKVEMSKDWQIIQGDALDVLKGMPDGSVQLCVTSPPYYGLRSYGTEPQVWGNHNGCSHVWGDNLRNPKAEPRTAEEKLKITGLHGSINFHCETANGTAGNFCLNCNAWRGELGLEPTFQLYLDHLIEIFAEVRRVLKADGVCFVNLGDSYAPNWSSVRAEGGAGTKDNGRGRRTREPGIEPKSLLNIPARFAIRMTDELQFINRNHIIWHKPACMPSSAKDRFTVDFESIYFFSKSPRYKFNQQLEPLAETSIERLMQPNIANQFGSIGNGGAKTNGNMKAVGDVESGLRNKRTVWTVNFEPSGDEHYAAYPTKLIEPMILAGSDEGDTVLDPFNGTGTTGLVVLGLRRKYIGLELQPKYIEISERRLREVQVNLFV